MPILTSPIAQLDRRAVAEEDMTVAAQSASDD
jgi:hypothetical protein